MFYRAFRLYTVMLWCIRVQTDRDLDPTLEKTNPYPVSTLKKKTWSDKNLIRVRNILQKRWLAIGFKTIEIKLWNLPTLGSGSPESRRWKCCRAALRSAWGSGWCSSPTWTSRSSYDWMNWFSYFNSCRVMNAIFFSPWKLRPPLWRQLYLDRSSA